jgi:selenoprotein W-related protein
LADAIKQKTGDNVELIEGSGGIFDVVQDGRKIYSKHDTGRFPEHDEILSQL